MSLTGRDLWTVIHGMGLGALFLLAFAGGLAGLWSLRPEWVTIQGMRERTRRLIAGTWVMAIIAWVTVITGTYVVYPWYRAPAPQGTSRDVLAEQYPRIFLLSSPDTALWHTFGMEWKEHVAWLAPILATAVAFVVMRYGTRLAQMPQVRTAVITLFGLAFLAAAAAGLFGAFINKVAPTT
ncbi:MAG: hypothetical protein HY332_11725 [Chloroflexi bacterium]|nr:hypothetical protein [Chloroflexota bacterium]